MYCSYVQPMGRAWEPTKFSPKNFTICLPFLYPESQLWCDWGLQGPVFKRCIGLPTELPIISLLLLQACKYDAPCTWSCLSLSPMGRFSPSYSRILRFLLKVRVSHAHYQWQEPGCIMAPGLCLWTNNYVKKSPLTPLIMCQVGPNHFPSTPSKHCLQN